MGDNKKCIGVLTRLTKKENDLGTYLTGWIETPNNKSMFFHQNSLLCRDEKRNIREGLFVSFEEKKTYTKHGQRNDAVNCSWISDENILKDILEYETNTISFIIEKASKELKTQLNNRIDTAKSKPAIPLMKKIDEIRLALPKDSQAAETKINIIQEEIKQKSFLEHVFERNTAEYNRSLFQLLIDGIKIIDNQEFYLQAKVLMIFNESSADKIQDLNDIFYQKATEEFKFKLWLEGFTEYCATDIIKKHFDLAENSLREEILKRCRGDENGFLMLNKNKEFEEVYFSNIRSILLKKLDEAKREIRVAVAWFTNDELFNMLCQKLKEGVNVELIIINDYINNWEFGLPFQTFIDMGGILYLCEYPHVMHHKFCIIDDCKLFNGSYNWTYYAENYNDENLMYFEGKKKLIAKFNEEFEQLKVKLGSHVTTTTYFNYSEIERFERTSYRKYFSQDLNFKAQAIHKTNVVHASKLAELSVKYDSENQKAITFLERIKPDVILEENKATVQKIAIENTENPKALLNRASNYKNSINIIDSNGELSKRTATAKENNYSIPEKNIASYLYQNLQLVVALDYSNSMQDKGDNHNGYKLYSTGKIQKVINMLYSISTGLTSEQNIDMFLFERKTVSLEPISKNNYQDYVKVEMLDKYKMYGTDIFSPIETLYEKYKDSEKTTFIIIITDGENNHEESNLRIEQHFKKNDSSNMFWQFVGLGENFAFLEKLENISSNVSFFKLIDVQSVSEDTLLERLLSRFPSWIEKTKLPMVEDAE